MSRNQSIGGGIARGLVGRGLAALAGLACVVMMAAPARACADASLSGPIHRFSGADLYSPQSFPVVAGGSHDLTECLFPGAYGPVVGYSARTPSFTFYLEAMQGFSLEIRVTSACDAVLLLNGMTRHWYFNDDSNGDLDPRVFMSRPRDAGWLDVLVGTFDGVSCDATLTLETLQRQ